MSKQIQQSAIVKAHRPKTPPNALVTYPDGPRYKFGFGVASESSGRIYKISFDAAPGACWWVCSCPGCIRHGQCKHLTACGLQGRAGGHQTLFARKQGLLT